MRRALILTAAVLSAFGAGPAAAQQYLGWAGKPAASTHPATANAPVAVHPDLIGRTVAPTQTRPAAALSTGPVQPRPGRGLTPASAWLTPHAAAPASHAVAYAPPPPAAVTPVAAPVRDAPTPRLIQPIRAEAAVVQPVQPAPTAPTPAPSEPAAAPADDPMAPRRDAPIFRLTQGGRTQGQPAPAAPQPQAPVAVPAAQPTAQAAPAPSAPPPASQGNRYYSVHRQAGRQPDAVGMPQPVYLDALPVELTQPPASRDLAEPGAPPTLLRGADGRVQAMTPATDGDLP